MSILSLKNWRDYPDGREKYSLYLASRDWAVLKEAARARCGGICERCRNAACEQLHHQTYERKYAELLEDLVYLCKPCHEFISGKRDDDPSLKGPVRLMGREIKSVYLSGSISGTRWRDEIVTGGRLPLPDGRLLGYAGPGWKRGVRPRDLSELVAKFQLDIIISDLVFVWIDSRDCHGTMVEIGYAAALDKTVVIAWPNEFDMDEFWMATHLSTIRRDEPQIQTSGQTAKQAWDSLWSSSHLVDPKPRNA